MLGAAVKKELVRILGNENVSFLREDLIAYSYDATAVAYPPDCVVFPSNAEEVSGVLKLAAREVFPVVPRGAGTGFTGGSLAVRAGVVMSFERMAGIKEIDASNLTAEVEPGVITGDFQDEVEAMGLFYPPDPTSVKVSTIGGNIAECAGGPRAIKYGVTRDYVLGLEVVLPTGELVFTGGKKTLKGVAGYDLTRLIVGSEGTLGVVTKAHLKLLPLPQAKKTMLARFSDIETAFAAVEAIIGEKVIPSTLEIIDDVTLDCMGETVIGRGGAALIIEVDGWREAVEKEGSIIRGLLSGAMEFRIAADKNEVKDIWNVRRSISPALSKIKPTKLNEDVVVPRGALVSFIKGVRDISKKRAVIIACFGHAGDGNIHVNVMVDKNDPVEFRNGTLAVEDIFSLAVGLGGTISGEHGVGITKAPYLGMELSADTIAVMKKIKDALDPAGILNPGKIFRESSPAPG
jgi:glycolate oxidase